jgi:hypothetical protein
MRHDAGGDELALQGIKGTWLYRHVGYRFEVHTDLIVPVSRRYKLLYLLLLLLVFAGAMGDLLGRKGMWEGWQLSERRRSGK